MKKILGVLAILLVFITFTASLLIRENERRKLDIISQTSNPTNPLPDITSEPIIVEPSKTLSGNYGSYRFHGRVLATNGKPIVGATISYTKISIVNSTESGIVTTELDGSFYTKYVYLHDTDRITMTAQATGYIAQTVTKQQMPIWYAGAYNFELSPLTGGTETPTLSP